MSVFNIRVNADKVEVEYSSDRHQVEVCLTGVDFDEVISEVGEQEAIAHFSDEVIREYVIDNDIHIGE